MRDDTTVELQDPAFADELTERRCQSKIDYFAQASESYFAAVDFLGFFGIKPSVSTHFPSIQNFALTVPSEAVLHLRESTAQGRHRVAPRVRWFAPAVGADFRHQNGQLSEVAFLHAVAGHFLGPHAYAAGRGEAGVVVERLGVRDDVGRLQQGRGGSALARPHPQQHLVGLGEAEIGIPLNAYSPDRARPRRRP